MRWLAPLTSFSLALDTNHIDLQAKNYPAGRAAQPGMITGLKGFTVAALVLIPISEYILQRGTLKWV